ncbi:MAG: four helix bundle protein [Ignavibacteriota bacterium]|jgi:four helix bundle protein|nr:MAG: four helix bundle protein [Chlorobiota bacterium]MBE7477552.1 four helix bundle protein [Ignavibacteriales bacterium]MBL1123934.1 four helix bundle protein [Ignavibacteriota bacterium]MCC7095164.1 four helix bundle protein [Ignavibacteriaceae bacterium]MCE7857299.1 four helix bundle protein [Ignavibacteria bacterium CHB3]MEB2295277.1 four helix bundle protein [Ignavibacteria bacterium]
MLELSHKKLDVWIKSMELVTEIYKLTIKFPIQEKYGLTSQIRRSAISVPSNISEGNARISKQERLRFLEIARASLVELDTQIEIAIKLNYLNSSDTRDISEMMNHTFAMLSKFIQKIKNDKRSE